jgi:hypothetical protein
VVVLEVDRKVEVDLIVPELGRMELPVYMMEHIVEQVVVVCVITDNHMSNMFHHKSFYQHKTTYYNRDIWHNDNLSLI